MKKTDEWTFEDIVPANETVLRTPLAAVMYPDDHTRLFYLNPYRVVQELKIDKSVRSHGDFHSVNAQINEGCYISTVPQRWKNERFSPSGQLLSYGLKSGNWDTPGTIAVEVHPRSPMTSVNAYPEEWASPYIRTFYFNRAHEIRSLGWDDHAGSWHTDSTPFSKTPSGSAKFAATWKDARGSSHNNITGPQQIMLFVVDNSELQVAYKVGEQPWGEIESLGSRQRATYIAATCAKDTAGDQDVHVFTSGENGKIVHTFLRNEEWATDVVDPFLDLTKNIRGGSPKFQGQNTNEPCGCGHGLDLTENVRGGPSKYQGQNAPGHEACGYHHDHGHSHGGCGHDHDHRPDPRECGYGHSGCTHGHRHGQEEGHGQSGYYDP
ncbi:hypothetical protein ABW20_dc0105518 [Dactylellina cionopaga]|nr:hypothetical protein ABW20_dc0105518 [Dactylellina cionopaga]